MWASQPPKSGKMYDSSENFDIQVFSSFYSIFIKKKEQKEHELSIFLHVSG